MKEELYAIATTRAIERLSEIRDMAVFGSIYHKAASEGLKELETLATAARYSDHYTPRRFGKGRFDWSLAITIVLVSAVYMLSRLL